MKRALIAALALTACVEAGSADETQFAGDVSQMDWILSQMDGKPVDFTATLNLAEPGKLRGQAPCNTYFGEVRREGDMFAPGMFASTRMACDKLPAEMAFLGALQGVTTAKEGAGHLVLSGGGHELHFVRPVN